MDYRNGVCFYFLLLPEGCSVKPKTPFCFPFFDVLIKVVMTYRLHPKGLFSPPIRISRSQVQSLSGIPVTQKIATFFGLKTSIVVPMAANTLLLFQRGIIPELCPGHGQ